jgi:hypothetical protein
MFEFHRTKRFFRNVKYYLQKKRRGYSDLDTWNVGYSVARYALPMLKAHRNQPPCGFPCEEGMTYEKWLEIIDKMIYSLQYMADDNIWFSSSDANKVREGCELFGKYLQGLWD